MSSVGFRVFTKVNRADRKLVERFKNIPVSNIDDVMNKIAGVHSSIKPFNKVKLLGTAITVKVPMGDNLMFHQALLMAEAGDVIVVDGNGCTERAICGENMMQIARKKGINGFLIDGAIRDSDAVETFEDFSIFARNAQANASYKALGPGEINIPVCIGGIVVYPGDIIVGDFDGVVAIRPQDAQEIAELAEKLSQKEKETLKQIMDGTIDRSWVTKALKAKNCVFLDKTWDE